MYTINDPTNEIYDDQGNRGVISDGDPVYTAYLLWVSQDPENNIPNHTFDYPPAPAEPKLLSKLDFMNRFTMPEMAAVYTAAKQNVLVEILLDQLKMAEFINTTDPRVMMGINMLEQAGLIDAGRASEILNG